MRIKSNSSKRCKCETSHANYRGIQTLALVKRLCGVSKMGTTTEPAQFSARVSWFRRNQQGRRPRAPVLAPRGACS